MTIKPFNWYGGKQRILKVILTLIPEGIEEWHDACMGSAVVTLNKRRHPLEVINDLDYELVNFFSLLADRKTGEELVDRLSRLPYSEDEFKNAQREKEKNFKGIDPLKMAEMSFVLITQSFNTTRKNFRAGISTEKYQSIVRHDLPYVYDRLRDVKVTKRNAIEIVDEVKDNPKAFCFLDVPYLHELRGKGSNKIYTYEMKQREHIELLNVIKDAKCRIMLCGYRNPDGNDLYDNHLLKNGWKHYLAAELQKSCQVNRKKRDIAQEWVWLNYEPPECAKYFINMGSVLW